MRVRDVEVADIRPPSMARHPLAPVEDLQLDVADHFPTEDRGQAGAIDPHRPPGRQPGQRHPVRMRQVLDPDEVDHLGVPGVPEPGPLIQGADMRPLLGNAVDAGYRQLAARLLTGDAPLVQLGGTGRDQLLGRLRRVRPVRIAAGWGLRPEQQPADLADAAVIRAHPVIGGVAQQVRGRGDTVPLLSDQGHPLAYPRIDDELARLALQLAEHGSDRHTHTRHDSRGVRVYQSGQLIPVSTVEPAYLDRRHEQASSAEQEKPRSTGPATSAVQAAL
jgi:hypothetical protein